MTTYDPEIGPCIKCGAAIGQFDSYRRIKGAIRCMGCAFHCVDCDKDTKGAESNYDCPAAARQGRREYCTPGDTAFMDFEKAFMDFENETKILHGYRKKTVGKRSLGMHGQPFAEFSRRASACPVSQAGCIISP
jgi:hypothetical protein